MLIAKMKLEQAESLLHYFKELVATDPKRVERPQDVAKITLEAERSWIQARIEDEKQKEMFVLCVEDGTGNVVAEGEVERKKRWIERHVAEIRFGVLPGHELAAKQMVAELIGTAKENGLEVLFYFHLKSQTTGIQIMKDLGFEEMGVLANYYKLASGEYVDRVFLSKQL